MRTAEDAVPAPAHHSDRTRPLGACTLGSRAEDLPQALQYAAGAGFDGVELSAQRLDVLYRGQLHRGRTKNIAHALNAAGLTVSVHQPGTLDLRTNHEVEVMQQMLHSLVELCHEIGAEILVIHYGQPSDDPAVEAQFERLLLAAADRADGTVLAVENIEVAPSGRVVDLVERLAHPAIAMTWDPGHDILAADAFGYDIDEAARRCAPHVVHLHAQDNFGRYEPLRLTDRESYAQKGKLHWTALGRGDLHLPIGWGTIPWERLLTPLRAQGFNGTVVTEVLERFYEWHVDEIISGLQSVLDCLTTDDGH